MALRAFSSAPSQATRATRAGRRLPRCMAVHASQKQLSYPIILRSGAELKPLSLQEAMRFSGPAPELINGRLAMLGVLGAVGSELTTGQSVLSQFCSSPLQVLLLVAALSGASLAPIMRGNDLSEAFGPLTPAAEKTNGRVAMLALAALLAAEVARGSALL